MVDDVLKVDVERIKAMVGADVADLENLLADDLTYTHTNCVVDTKASLIGKLGDGRYDYRAIETYDVQLKRVGVTCVVLTGAAKMTINVAGENIMVPIRFTNVYVNNERGWKLTAWQSTRQPQ